MYRDKVRQLSKYIEPLRKMIAKSGDEDAERNKKMKNLLELLTNPTKRMPLETLLKCEKVLEKLDFKRVRFRYFVSGWCCIRAQNIHREKSTRYHLFLIWLR